MARYKASYNKFGRRLAGIGSIAKLVASELFNGRDVKVWYDPVQDRLRAGCVPESGVYVGNWIGRFNAKDGPSEAELALLVEKAMKGRR